MTRLTGRTADGATKCARAIGAVERPLIPFFPFPPLPNRSLSVASLLPQPRAQFLLSSLFLLFRPHTRSKVQIRFAHCRFRLVRCGPCIVRWISVIVLACVVYHVFRSPIDALRFVWVLDFKTANGRG